MKKIFLYAVLIGISMQMEAQVNYGSRGVYGSNDAPVTVLENTAIREVVGGTVIIPVYYGSGFNDKIKGAFERACRIWEEKIPTAYPIRIEVRMQAMGSNISTLAGVNVLYSSYPTDAVRAQNKRFAQTGLPCEDSIIKDSIDATITFNSSKAFDYGTDTVMESPNKYDFVTVAIYAIGKVLGFYVHAYYDGTNLVINNPSNSYTEYLFGDNTSINYQQTVNSGGLSISYGNNYWSLYSPSVYNSSYSFNCFNRDGSNNETLFLQPGISKGSVIRNIGSAVSALFYRCHWLERNYATGNSGNTIVNGASTGNVIPYSQSKNMIPNSLSNTNSNSIFRDDDTGLYTYMYRRREEQSPGKYVLLKDGAWEQYTSFYNLPVADSLLARTADGYVRTMTVSQVPGPYGYYYNTVIQHSLYSYPPQTPVFSICSVEASNINNSYNDRVSRNPLFAERIGNRTDDEFIDVEIGFRNTEGCTSILVEQTDSDWPIPYTYIVDPGQGSFIAYMNRPYPSTIKLTYINNEGQTVGTPQVYDLSQYTIRSATNDVTSEKLIASVCGSVLHFTITDSTKDDEMSVSGNYDIYNVNSSYSIKHGKISNVEGEIDISDLPSGLYVLIVNYGTTTLSAKWNKK